MGLNNVNIEKYTRPVGFTNKYLGMIIVDGGIWHTGMTNMGSLIFWQKDLDKGDDSLHEFKFVIDLGVESN